MAFQERTAAAFTLIDEEGSRFGATCSIAINLPALILA
jgi:hypothetical protein